MNCRDVDRIVDDHGERGLSAGARADFDAHLARCARCRGAIEAHELLRRESFAGPRPGFFEATSRFVASRPLRVETAPRASRSQTFAGLAAAAALALVVLLGLPRLGTESAAPRNTPFAAYVEGEHYLGIASPLVPDPTVLPVSVIEFFMYLCNPCYQFEPRLVAWMATRDTDTIEVTRVPIQWNERAALHARAFYTAEVLGVTDAVHDAFFEEIHVRNNPLASEAELKAFFVRRGVDQQAFDDAFRSLAVETRLAQARELADRFGVAATPSIVVGDSWLATPTTAGSYEGLIGVVDWLVGEIADRCSIERCR